MDGERLGAQATALLAELLRFKTVNPPGDERPAIEHLERLLRVAGFETELFARDQERPNLVADLRGRGEGPTLAYLGHLDTVVAEPADWRFDPWSGTIADGFVWGRGALDMKGIVACEAVAAAALARAGWRPARGSLKLIFVVDEEEDGSAGASWLVRNHPDRVRCELLINEGAGPYFDYGGRRCYGVECAEKGVLRFSLTARGEAGHASNPKAGDNALFKLARVLLALERAAPALDLTPTAAMTLRALGEDPADPAAALSRIAERDRRVAETMVEPTLGVTFVPTIVSASEALNVIPARAAVKVDCRVPPGHGEQLARRRLTEALGPALDGVEIEFFERVDGNESPPDTPLMDAITAWVARADPGAATVPVCGSGFTDSAWWRAAFPGCIAYGFCPQRHMDLFEVSALEHNADERIDVRDLAFASRFYADLARSLLGAG